MLNQMDNSYPAILNQEPIENTPLTAMAFSGFAHFTALQVRNKKVKGLDLHLARLRQASLALYQTALKDSQITHAIAKAIASGPQDLSLTVTLFAPQGEFNPNSAKATPSVLVRTSAPAHGPAGPLRLASFNYERPLADIKHVGEIGKTYYLHQAIKQGFDDAAFVDNQGHISEGSIWNLVFWDGKQLIWPRAALLEGTMMGIVKRQLSALGVPQRTQAIKPEHLAQFQGAAVMNSWTPGINVSAIDTHSFSQSDQLVTILHQAFALEPAVTVME